MQKGKFITFEGLDGSGKSTQANLLLTWLEQQGHEVVYLREPGGTNLGEKIRHLLLDVNENKMADRSELHLFLAARAQLCAEVIRPALHEGKVVLCDRFFDSTLAYQGYGRGLDVEQLILLNDFATQNLQPDLTFLLQLPASQVAGRLAQRGIIHDRMECEPDSFRLRVHQGYEDLAQRYARMIRIEANQTISTIQKTIQTHVKEVFR